MSNELLQLLGLEPRPTKGSPPRQASSSVGSIPGRRASPGEYRWGKPLGLRGSGVKVYPYATPEMAGRILAVVPSKLAQAKKGSNWQLFFAVLWQTGVRIGEALELEREDVQGDGSLLVRCEKKHGAEIHRRIPLQMPMFASLQAHMVTLPDRQRRLFNYGSRRAAQVLKQAAARAGYDPRLIHPHIFRHGFAMNFLRQNGTGAQAVARLQQLLGHKRSTTTMIYLSPSFGDLTADIDRMRF